MPNIELMKIVTYHRQIGSTIRRPDSIKPLNIYVTGMGRLEGTRVVELGVKQDDFMYFVGYRLNYRENLV